MARTANEIAKEHFGNMMLEIVRLTTENEQLKEKLLENEKPGMIKKEENKSGSE